MKRKSLTKQELKKANERLDMYKIKSKEDRENFIYALEDIKTYMPKTIYTKLTNVSRSGMSRSIDVYISHKGEVLKITWQVSKILRDKIDNKNGGVKTYGCGMDMGFNLIYNFSYVITQILNIKCVREDGGYYFRQEWI